MITTQEVTARVTEKITQDLLLLAGATPDAHAQWQPTGVGGGLGRSILNQLIECSAANIKWTSVLNARDYVLPEGDAWKRAYLDVHATKNEVLAKLLETSTALVTAIRALSDDDAAKELPLPWEPNAARTLAEAALHPYWNMVYHEGQINYIQTLYNDKSIHGDVGPFGK